MKDKLSSSLQENIITILAFDDEQGKIIANLIDPNLFEGDYRIIAERAVNYWRQYETAPKDHTADLVADILEDPANRRSTTYKRILAAMHELAHTINTTYVLAQLSQFTRTQRLKDGILRSAEKLNSNQEMAVQEVEDIWNELLRVREQNFDPGMRLSDVNRMLNYFEKQQGEFNTGIKEFDRRNIVPARGALSIFIAPSGFGKCIAEGQLILMPDGSRKKIEDVVYDRDEQVLSLDEKTGKLKPSNIVAWHTNGKKKCFIIETYSGRSIVTTENHQYLTEHGWKMVGDLRENKDHVAVPSKFPVLGTNTYNPERLRLLGYLIADGNLRRTDTSYGKLDFSILRDFVDCIEAIGDKISWVKFNKSCYVTSKTGKHNSCRTREWLKEIGLSCKKSKYKFVPKFIFELDNEHIAIFLRALLSSDSSIYGRKQPIIEYSSASARLVEDVRHLLLRFGILTRIKYFTARFKEKKLPGYAKLYITNTHNMNRFLDKIGYFGKKAEQAKKYYDRLDNLQNPYNLPMWMKPYSKQVVLDKVKSIEYVGYLKTYDIAVEQYHNFVVEDFIAHNSWYLVHLGKQALQQRKKVLHITLELSEEETTQRYYQSMFSIPKRDIGNQDITTFEFNSMNKLSGFGNEIITPEFNFDSQEIRLELDTRSDLLGNRFQNLLVKKFPMRGLTMKGLYGYLDNLEIVEKFIPDLLVIDYPKLMRAAPGDPRIMLGQLMEDIKGIADARHIAIAAVHQSAKAGVNAGMVRSTHVAEDWSIIATADQIITYSRTDTEKRYGLARLYVDKARSEQDKFGLLISQQYSLGQFCLSSTLLDSKYFDKLKELDNDEEGEEPNDTDDDE